MKDKRTHIDIECNTPFLRQLKSDVQNIAKNKGLTLAAYLKGLMIEARDKSPVEKRTYTD